MVRVCFAAMLVVALAALVAGCGDSSSSLPSSYAGVWSGTMHIGENTVAAVSLAVGSDGQVLSGTVDTPSGMYAVTSGTFAYGGGIELRFGEDASGHFLAGSSTLDGNLLSGSGGFTPPGGSKQTVLFELTRSLGG